MINEELIDNKNNCKKEITVMINNVDLYNNIIEFNKNFNNISWSCKVYNYVNNIIELPKCYCGNILKFHTFKTGYKKYCSVKCATSSIEFKQKKEKTILNKFGVKNISQLESIKNKKKITLLNNYGVTHQSKSEYIKQKKEKTILNKFGVKNISQSELIKDKKIKTFKRKYGVNHLFQSEEFKKNNIIHNQNKYGVDHYVQSDENKKHIKNNLILKQKIFWANQLNIDISNIDVNDNIFTIKNLCKKHNTFEINRYNLYNRTIVYKHENICTICNPISEQSSIKENEIRDFIENNLKIKTKKIRIDNKEIDIYLPDYRIGIEFNGLYWHSELFKNKNYHLNKTEMCENQGIQLLHVFEDEWMFKKEIVKSIIKSKLNIYNTKIYARKCQIKEIDSVISNRFLNNNHLQGKINSKIKLGLFYDNELVSLMTFGKKRIALGGEINNDEYEMLRFCNNLNTQVIGGASKLLKYFINTYNPKSIISFADRRYSNGELYKQLGFEYKSNTKPNYWYFKPTEMIRYHRFKFRKDVLIKMGFNINKTEFEIMNELKYLQIYDCGSMKFQIML